MHENGLGNSTTDGLSAAIRTPANSEMNIALAVIIRWFVFWLAGYFVD
jgi:hypothetical protein